MSDGEAVASILGTWMEMSEVEGERERECVCERLCPSSRPISEKQQSSGGGGGGGGDTASEGRQKWQWKPWKLSLLSLCCQAKAGWSQHEERPLFFSPFFRSFLFF